MQFSFASATLFVITACSHSIADYQDTDPEFALFEFFEGEVLAWGMLQDRSGQQTRRFEVQIQGEIQGQLLTLTEDFVFDDGEKQQRIWKITARADGTYIGEADDVIGEANGVVSGNALHWQYVLRVPVDDTTYDISFDDWMFRQDDKRMFNVATMSKFGVNVGKVTLFFEKQE
ncbi:hypothetical protein A3K86_21760 [Photobacterium jeanii]|uniref:Lipoprotein n=1 Tax=Photobacterium jeanii TaxID=858640 RepID=A0A178K4T9_9GAMM|nr:hypothetical protein A3K86_21760 [Photobacterium jeanii]